MLYPKFPDKEAVGPRTRPQTELVGIRTVVRRSGKTRYYYADFLTTNIQVHPNAFLQLVLPGKQCSESVFCTEVQSHAKAAESSSKRASVELADIVAGEF